MKDTMNGVDLAKRVFQVHGAEMSGKVKFRKKLSREQFRAFMAAQPLCLVVFEACAASVAPTCAAFMNTNLAVHESPKAAAAVQAVGA